MPIALAHFPCVSQKLEDVTTLMDILRHSKLELERLTLSTLQLELAAGCRRVA